jgi:prevent-host-death family protein
MKKVPLTELKDDLSKFLRLAETEQIVITRHGRPAGVLVGFASDDEWFNFQLENDPRFLSRIEQAVGGELAITCTYQGKRFRPEVSMDVYLVTTKIAW